MCTSTSGVGAVRDGMDGGPTLQINEKIMMVAEDRELINIPRNDCHLKSVKDGCNEGACGVYAVLVDGKPTKVCVQKASKFVDKSIVTVEGFVDREEKVFIYAFGEVGAVQYDFCIPGMVICARGLLDVSDHPARTEIMAALRSNIYRCTGHKKIVDAVELAVELFRGNVKDLKTEHITGVGQKAHRADAREKALGYDEYVDNMGTEYMIYGSAIRTPYPRTWVLSANKSEALALSDARAVLTVEDVSGNDKVDHLKKDWDTTIPVDGIIHYVDDAICLVATDTPEVLEEARKLVEIEYKELPGVFSSEEALAEGAPLVHETGNLLVHEHLTRGDVEQTIKDTAYVVTMGYETPLTERALLEPECVIAIVDKDGQEALLYISDQGTYDTQHKCTGVLGWDNDKVHIINKPVGGGFDGKRDISVQHHAALLSCHTGLSVKVKLTRKESVTVHPERHPTRMTFTTAYDKNGYLLGMKTVVMTDTDVYVSLDGSVLQRLYTHTTGSYNCRNTDIDGRTVYTNNPPADALRGFSVTQSCFTTECDLSPLAEEMGISPRETRYRNAIRSGQVLLNGQITFPGIALVEILEAVKEIYENHPRAGIVCTMKSTGVGVGLPDWGRCHLTMEDGKVHIRPGVSCIGQGLGAVLIQMTYEALGISDMDIVYVLVEADLAPGSDTTFGPRQTLATGETLRWACDGLKADLEGKALVGLNSREYYGEYLATTDRIGADKENPVSYITCGYAAQVALLREDGTVEQIVMVYDVGKAISPLSVEGQTKGGVVMLLGYTLTEDYPLERGRPTAEFDTLGLFCADKTPDVKSIIMERNRDTPAFSAVGIGEITSISMASAVQGAYYRFDREFRTKLPLERTPYSRKK